MRSKLLFLGVDTSTRFAIEYAKNNGAYTVITDYKTPEESPIKLMTDEYWIIDVADVDLLEKKCREENITGIYSGNNEFCLDRTKELTGRLDLPFYASDEGWACARDKGLFKEYCQKAGIDVPKRYAINKPITSEMLDAIPGPVIIKPVDACASKGITVCNSREEIEAAYEYALQFSNSGNVIVEDYVDGIEVISFFYIDEGIAYVTHVNVDVFTVPGGNPTNSGGTVLKHRGYTKFIQEELSEKFQKLFNSMNCKHGVIFVQGKLFNGKYYVFEMGYRLDGLCDFKVTKPLFGFSALEAMVDLALGRNYPYNGETYLSVDQNRVGMMFLIWANPGKISKVISEEIRNTEGIDIIMERRKAGEEIFSTNNMLQIPYYISIIAENPIEMVGKIRKINSDLQLLDEQGNNLLVPFDRFEDLYQALS